MKNNELNIQSGERLTFFKLFTEKSYHVEIPIIQRDYAQGRDSSSEVREIFLDALFNYLEGNKPNRDLDFVYGSLLYNGNIRFIPLDGQQRLTTLFLLHWYLANISDNMCTLREALLTQDNKSKFTYLTRTSSRDFCDELMSKDIDMSQLVEPDEEKQNSLSKTIRDCGWYYLSWENDPTIQSMLTMLDAIHGKFSGNPDFFKRLVEEKNPVITFLFLNLKEFKLTDDLYIKMNARGKPLTTFENFKAKFEQHIRNLNWKSATPYTLEFDNEEKSVSTQEYFSYKIDTNWANLFWNYRNVNGKDNSIDDELMNFIRVIIANQYAIDSKNEKDKYLEFLIGTQVARKRKDYTDNITYHLYKRIGVLTKDAVTYLINALDKLTNGDGKISPCLSDTFYDEQKVFKKVLQHDLTFPQRVQFHAYIKYLINNNGNAEGIYQWMRVMHNLTENTPIDGAEEVAKAIKSVEKLLSHSSNVLDFLISGNAHVDFFWARPVQEEKIKAHLIKKSPEWKDVIEEIEKHPYFTGQIGFLLEFSKVLAYYEEHGNCEWTVEEDNNHLKSFKGYTHKAALVFKAIDPSLKKKSSDIDFLWERAVLTKGDYLIHATSWRRNFLSTTINMRDYSWKRLLRLPPKGTNKQDAKEWENKRSFVKDVFDDVNFNSNELIKSLTEICKSTSDGWRKYFIENPELIGYCEQGFIRFESSSEILLFKQSQQNHRHREMYSYNLFLTELSGKDTFAPFNNLEHYEIRSSDDFSCALLDDWCHNKKHFAIDVYYDNNDKNLPNPFEIFFYKPKGNEKKEEYPNKIKLILNSLKFEWEDDKDSSGYWISEKTEEDTIAVIKNLCKKLQGLTQ